MSKEEFYAILEKCESSKLNYFRYISGVDEIEFSKTPICNIDEKKHDLPLNHAEWNQVEERVGDIENDRIIQMKKTNINYSENLYTVFSKQVGTVHSLPVFVDKSIEKGDILCTLEAMKLYNDIQSPVSGIVEEIFIKLGENIGYDQEICKIKVKEDEKV